MGLPVDPHLEFLPCAEPAQKVQDCAALVSRQPVDVGSEVAIDVDALRFVTRWVRTTGCDAVKVDLAGFLAAYPRIIPAIDMIARMRRGQPFE